YRWKGIIYNAKTDTLLKKVDFEIGMCDFFCQNDSVWFSGLENDAYRLDNAGMHTLKLPATNSRFGTVGNKLFAFGTAAIMDYRSDTEMPVIYQFQQQLKRTDSYINFCISGNLVLYSWSDRLILLEWKIDHFEQLDVLEGTSGQVFSDRDGNFWVCSLTEGALFFSTKNKNLSSPKLFLKGKKITAMFEDRQRTRWFCTSGQGIYALPANAAMHFTQLAKPNPPNITALYADSGSNVYAGDDAGNIHHIDPKNNIVSRKFFTKDGYNRCRQILGTPNGVIVYGTDEGIFVENKGMLRTLSNITTGIKGILYHNNHVWFATFSRVGYLKNADSKGEILCYRRFASIGDDNEGNVWAGGIDGFYSLKDGFKHNWGAKYPQLKNRINSIQNAGGQYVWVSNPESGLLRLKVMDGKVVGLEIINDSLGVAPIHNIQSMYKEPGGRLWLSTNQGVFGLDETLNVVRYDHRDGLANDDVNAVTVTGDTLWIGTVSGLTRLKMLPNTKEGNFRTMVTAVHYQQGKEGVTKLMIDAFDTVGTVIHLPMDASLVSVDLAGLDFRSSGGLRYVCTVTERLLPLANLTFDNLLGWMMNGFKPKKQTQSITTGSFDFGINMLPGRYELVATAVNSRGGESNHPVRIELMMPAHLYETIWFWFLIWGMLGFLVYKMVDTQSAIHCLRASISELQLQALQTQINPHFIGNAINSVQQFFYPPDPAKASEYVTLLTRMLRRTLEFSERSFIHFGDEVAYDSDYLELNHLRFGEHLIYSIEGADAINAQTPFPTMMVQPLLENATLHGIAPDGKTVLNLRFEMLGKKLVCTLTDNGIGINAMQQRPTEHGRVSKGLQMLHKKAETINQLYGTNMTLQTIDLGDQTNANSHGTRVVLSFEPAQVYSMRSRGVRRLLNWLFKKRQP
ncbi:MAG: histidine kinase, partial [Saprospiraceae bacterium]|nr:histidine kinase [Saprospiraceae bacterium]